jgi:hypothetical protein
MANINNDYLYKSGEIELSILLEDNGFQESLDEALTDPIADKYYVQYLRLMIKYNMSAIKRYLNDEFYNQRHMTRSDNGWIHISPSLRDLVNRFGPIPQGYPEWFILLFPDVILWASYDGLMIHDWIVKLEKNDDIQLADEGTNSFSIYILEEIIKKYLNYYTELECSILTRFRV